MSDARQLYEEFVRFTGSHLKGGDNLYPPLNHGGDWFGSAAP